MSSSSKNILWWCHVFTFIIVLMTPVLSMFYVLIVFDNKCKSNECLIFLNPDTNNLWGEFCSNWYDRVSQWHDMMLSTFSPQKQKWALHFHNKHKSGSDSTQLLRSVLPIYQKFSLKNMKNVLEMEIQLNPMIWFLYFYIYCLVSEIRNESNCNSELTNQ